MRDYSADLHVAAHRQVTGEAGGRLSSASAGVLLGFCAGSGAVEQEVAFACVARERCGALELRFGFGEATELE